ncbi:hypothetical protein FDK12_08285 [Arthrobacter sp. NamB2]|uniref:hypothetical protein n=1 Tax=Arthrobacter sp. NamB2 TaxID=2576035 RepID=UPI0010C984EC|nr:hypothetical protein [Arthrobacter sp. NamB2]TKV28639.1 hypothetical protein FDK12_08285 [Arthrobacter sp. NamB2]
MTESSSAGNPGGAALPPDHPLGPAVPIPPLEKEAGRAEESARDGAGTSGSGSDRESTAEEFSAGQSDGSESDRDGGPRADRRESVLDPSAGSTGPRAGSIRDEQGTHSAGAVPAAYNGEGAPEDPAEDRHPEDAAAEPDSWDSGGAGA